MAHAAGGAYWSQYCTTAGGIKYRKESCSQSNNTDNPPWGERGSENNKVHTCKVWVCYIIRVLGDRERERRERRGGVTRGD